MNEVSAVVLTLDEPHTERALASLSRQTVAPAEIIVVRGLTPFQNAVRYAATRVKTDFFLQVDADMVLDNTCIEDFTRCIGTAVGVVAGRLRDPLLGRILGIKMYRTQCFARTEFLDAVSPGSEFSRTFVHQGWRRVEAVSYRQPTRPMWHSFGEHLPDYTPWYAFERLRVQGARHRHRKAGRALRALFGHMQSSSHPLATIAQIGAAHGIFASPKDLPFPYAPSSDFALLEAFMQRPDAATGPTAPALALGDELRSTFTTFYRYAVELARAGSYQGLARCMRSLTQPDEPRAWVGLVGLCQGLFAGGYSEGQDEADFGMLLDLLEGG